MTDGPATAAPSSARPKICIVNNTSFMLKTLCHGFARDLQDRGFEVHAVVGDDLYQDFPESLFGNITIHKVPMERNLSPVKDIVALFHMWNLFRKHHFDIIHVSTPKPTLLGNLAGWLTGNGPRIYVYRRRFYELMPSHKQRAYILFDKWMARMSAFVVPISQELERQLLADSIGDRDKIRMAGQGSSNGIDTVRYSRTDKVIAAAAQLRASMNIPDGAPVVLYLGRLSSEKGLGELPEVFQRVLNAVPDVHFVVVGPVDKRDPAPQDALDYFDREPRVHRHGFAENPPNFYAMADVFVFPSYFEGYGNVLLEAAAVGCPAVAFDVSGVREAVADGQSGFLVPLGDRAAMADKCVLLLQDHALSRQMGATARHRAEKDFDRRVIWNALASLFQQAKALHRK